MVFLEFSWIFMIFRNSSILKFNFIFFLLVGRTKTGLDAQGMDVKRPFQEQFYGNSASMEDEIHVADHGFLNFSVVFYRKSLPPE